MFLSSSQRFDKTLLKTPKQRSCQKLLCTFLPDDVSAYGIGAEISDIMDDGSKRPIALAPEHWFHVSRTILKWIMKHCH